MLSQYFKFHTSENKSTICFLKEILSNASFELKQLLQKTIPLLYKSAVPGCSKDSCSKEEKWHLHIQSRNIQSLRKHVLEDCHCFFPNLPTSTSILNI